MNTKTITIAALALVGLFGLMWWGSTVPRADTTTETAHIGGATSTLSASETAYDFGSISMAKGKVTHRFAVKNTGAEPILVQKIYTSCMCTEASLITASKTFGPYGMPGHGFVPSVNQTLAPNEEASVEVVFDPAAHGPAGVGKIQRAVMVENSAGSPLQFQFSALVTP